MARVLRWVLSPVLWVLRWLLALVILFEEWGWEPLARWLGYLGRLPWIRQIEAAISALPPYGALAVFLLPSLLLIPVKLLALWFISQGSAALGIAVIVLAKLLGTALLARLFMLTQAQLMKLDWFARLYARWSRFKTMLLAQVRASAPYRLARKTQAAVRRWLKSN